MAQAGRLEEMEVQLLDQGWSGNFVAINVESAVEEVGKITQRCAFAVLQDTPDVMAVPQLLKAGKDDFLIYDSEGLLQTWLPYDADVSTDLGTDEGWSRVWEAALAAE